MDTYDDYDTYTTTFPMTMRSRRKSSIIAGATLHSAIFPTSSTIVHDSLISFLSYVKTQEIPILPVTKPDIRSVLGQGASFLVNGAEVPETYVDPVSGTVFRQGMTVAFKRAILNDDMHDPVADRIRVIFNELLTMHHPPLRAHPNIAKLLGIGFETEGPSDAQNAMPVLIPECAELGNLAEVLETARKEGRPLDFDQKVSMVLDIAHGLEILHACDIVHGDIKCENILVFENDDFTEKREGSGSSLLYCKLTDFGVLRLPDGGLMLGGSRPWQAPECSRGAYFKIEEAKRTDIYSFGMLIWRVFLDGDPFKSLGEFDGKTDKERRHKRNDAVAALKEDDRLVQHVCSSLALSEMFSRPCLEMLCEVISITLVTDSSKRELDLGRIIRHLTPNNWYQARHPVAPARLPLEIDANLLDMEKWHLEFDKASPVVQKWVASGYADYAEGRSDDSEKNYREKRTAAAYQLGICYANGFGVDYQPDMCLKWLSFAAEGGSEKAQEALPKLSQAFNKSASTLTFRDPWARTDDTTSELDSSWASDFGDTSKGNQVATGPPQWTYLNAAEGCRYDILEDLLSKQTQKPSTSEDGVSPLHFVSSWDIQKAEGLARRLVAAGADINARAKRGSTIGGTPLMWSVFGDHIAQSSVLLKLGADPMAVTDNFANGDDALTLAARLHQTAHLRLLMEHVPPTVIHGQLRRLIEAVAGGESRFTRMTRHGKRWTTAAIETLTFLQTWNSLFPDTENFEDLLVPALVGCLKSPYGRMNTDVQYALVRKVGVKPVQLEELLRDSVMTWNDSLFNALLEYDVPIACVSARKKSLLHLCAKIPDHSLAATAFAPRLLDLGADIEALDDDGITPWMEAILERKWDLADLLMERGANALATNREGFNVLGLCINTVNLGAIKYLMKYCAQKTKFHQDSFLVNSSKQISALQLAAAIPMPRAHGMKIEVIGTFLTILANFAFGPEQLDFRSNGLLPGATALDIAASKGNVHAVKNLCKKGAHTSSGASACTLAASVKRKTTDWPQGKNLERCIFIIENWDDEEKQTRRLADDWTNMKTIDESNVNSSWEIVVFDYKSRKTLANRVKQ